MDSLALMRLLQLASPSLPVGAYSYSQGLEAAISAQLVTDEPSAHHWVRDTLQHAIAHLEAPLYLRAHAAWAAGNTARFHEWNDWFLATRDTAEFRAETVQMGFSTVRLLKELPLLAPEALSALQAVPEIAAPVALAAAAAAMGIPAEEALQAYLFSWLENQVLAAVKAVPLGQAAGQRILFDLAGAIPALCSQAAALADDEISNWTPGLTLFSIAHETQYSRIFRS